MQSSTWLSSGFTVLDDETQLGFKDALNKFVRIVLVLLSQVVSFTDSKLERDDTYCRALASKLRDVTTIERLDLGTEVEVPTHLRTSRSPPKGRSRSRQMRPR